MTALQLLDAIRVATYRLSQTGQFLAIFRDPSGSWLVGSLWYSSLHEGLEALLTGRPATLEISESDAIDALAAIEERARASPEFLALEYDSARRAWNLDGIVRERFDQALADLGMSNNLREHENESRPPPVTTTRRNRAERARSPEVDDDGVPDTGLLQLA